MSDLIENIAICAICTNQYTCGYLRGIKVIEVKEALDASGCTIACPLTKQTKETSNTDGVNLALAAKNRKGDTDLTALAEQQHRNKLDKVNLAREASKNKNWVWAGEQ